MAVLKIDAAFLIDSFGVWNSRYVAMVWIHLKFKESKSEYKFFLFNINKIADELGFSVKVVKNSMKKLRKYGLILKNGTGFEYLTNERDFCNELRKIRKEKFYTRFAMFSLSDKFFYGFIKNIDDPLTFRIYYYLMLITQHDLWPRIPQIRSKISMNKLIKMARIWCLEESFTPRLDELTELGLILVDQNHKVHTFNRLGDSLQYPNLVV
jgi:hypothetical protein